MLMVQKAALQHWKMSITVQQHKGIEQNTDF